MTMLLDYRSNRIVELLEAPARHRDAEWLKESLQQALMLELATLPPYLCAMWSIEDPDHEVTTAIRRIVFDEMSHLGLVGNLLATIGGDPRLADERAVPKYPGPLPGGVRPGLTVFLSGFSKESLDLYSRIEEPDDPITEGPVHTSIGAFYSSILEAFRHHPELITGRRQLTRNMSQHGQGNDLVAITSLAHVEKVVAIIKEQGEGTSVSPDNPHPGERGELAHFYVFRELYHGRRLVRSSQNPDRWEFTGDEIPMPPSFPMGTVPEGGWGSAALETRKLLDAANHRYSEMLRFLEAAWQTDLPAKARELLTKAVVQMRLLEDPARTLMESPLPDGRGKTYGPEFRYTKT